MEKIYAQNKKAFHDYEILEKFEAGISLKGIEVKSIQLAKVSIKESFISVKDNNVIWKQGYINLLNTKDLFNRIEEVRDRQLLLHKKEIRKIKEAISMEGLTCIPLKIYKKDFGKLKIEIAIAKGKKNYDKRQSLKEKDLKREVAKNLKNY
jgi:SsrA-binding protein